MPTRVIDALNYTSELWDKPQTFLKNTAPTGMKPVDGAIGGVRLTSGGVWVVQGYEGSRKTTYILNALDCQFRSGRLPDNYWINYDTLESGMSVERVAEVMVCMLATKILVRWHYLGESDNLEQLFSHDLPPMPMDELIEGVGVTLSGGFKQETKLRPEMLRVGGWTERQRRAIFMARSVVAGYRLFLSGISEHPDTEVAKSLTTRTWDLGESLERWCQMSEEWGMLQLIVDNIPQYYFPDTNNAYEKVLRVKEAVLKWLREFRGIAWVVNQVPISQRPLNQRGAIMMDLPSQYGGPELLQECQIGWHLDYNPRRGPYHFRLAVKKTRIGFHPDLEIGIEPNSGAIIGEIRTAR